MSVAAPTAIWPADSALYEAITPGGVPKAAYKIEVGWGQGSTGLFTFGTSLFGSSTDLLAADSWSASFMGDYDDISADGRDIQITRGRDNDLTTIRAGQILTGLRDKDGRYNPQNPASPLAGSLDTDKPQRVSAIYGGVTYPLGYAFTTDIEADMAGRGTCQLTAVDFLDKLDRQSPVIAPLAGNSTDGQIFAAILDWFRWTDPSMRNLLVGDTIAAAWSRADGSRTGLALVSELLDAERGLVFVDKTGAVKYLDRQSRYASSSTGTIDRALTAFPVGRSNANIVNQWTVQRTDMAGVPVGIAQTAGDGVSQQRHGPIAQTLTTPFLNSDAQALSLAQFMTMRTATGLGLVYEVPISIADAATFIQVLSRDIGDRVTMTLQPRNMAQFTADFFIESIAHTIQTKGSPRHACVWRVSAAPSGTPFRFGVSTMGGTDVLWY